MVLRIVALGMYATFFAATCRLAAVLFSQRFAVVVALILSFGSDRVIKNELVGAGGYSEVAAATAGLLLVSTSLVLRRTRHVHLCHVAWGLLAGFITWSHWLALPYVAASAAVLAWARPPARSVALACTGFVVGCSPLLWHNLTGRSWSPAVLLAISGASEPAPLLDRLWGAVMVGLPLSTGLCAPSRCDSWQLWWGPVYLVLLAVSIGLSARGLRRDGCGGCPGRVVAAARLSLAIAALLTLLAYSASASSAYSAIESARYLHYMLVSLPVVLWPLWQAVSVPPNRLTARRAVGVVVLAAVAANAAVASVQLIGHVPTYRKRATDERILATFLVAHRYTRIYSEYWTCNRLAYITAETIRCAVLADDLTPGMDRYLPYRSDVTQATLAAYVMPVDSPANAAMQRWRGRPVRVATVAGYDIYIDQRR